MNDKSYWLIYSVAAALFWGIWGVVAKLISEEVNPYTNHVLFTMGMLVTLPFVVGNIRRTTPNRKGISWGLLSGALAVTGNVAVFKAFTSGGLAAIVIPVTNLYPLVTIGIALLVFKEKLNWLNVIGVVLAIPAVVMLSGQSLLFNDPAAFLTNLGLNTGSDQPWLVYSVVALVFWGLFSATQKVTTNWISAEWSYAVFIVSSVVIALGFVGFGLTDFTFSRKTLLLGTLAGALNGLGVLCSFAAYKAEGKAAQVTTIAGALQPVFTIILAISFLSERISFIEIIGIAVAMGAALALSYETKSTKTVLKPL